MEVPEVFKRANMTPELTICIGEGRQKFIIRTREDSQLVRKPISSKNGDLLRIGKYSKRPCLTTVQKSDASPSRPTATMYTQRLLTAESFKLQTEVESWFSRVSLLPSYPTEFSPRMIHRLQGTWDWSNLTKMTSLLEEAPKK